MSVKWRPIKDISWKRFWMLYVVSYHDTNNHLARFKCVCDCWNDYIGIGVYLRNWNTKSCWCWQWQHKHDMSTSRIYKIYQWLLWRCYNKKVDSYKYCWANGIICERNSFEEFYKDMWPTYQKWLTIDRIDNNWNYCKSNCRWATLVTQANNKTNNILIEYNWQTKTLAEWAKTLNMVYKTLYSRIHLRKWSVYRSFTQPVRQRLNFTI